MPWFDKPSMTRCLPMDSRLLKDHIKAQISTDVDHVEEISGAGLALNVVELTVLLFIVVAACAKSYSMYQRSRVARPAPPSIHVSSPTPLLGVNSSNSNNVSTSASSSPAADATVVPMQNVGAAADSLPQSPTPSGASSHG